MRKIISGLLAAALTLGAVPHLLPTQAAPVAGYSYMQIFYYGPRTTSGFAFMSLSPAFHGQTEIKLDEPNLLDEMDKLRGTVSSGVSYDSNDPRYQKQQRKEAQENAAENRKMIAAQNQRAQKMRDQLMKTLNTAAAEDWEVVQMSGFGDSGLVYLLRHAK